jgi:hypothetical protein
MASSAVPMEDGECGTSLERVESCEQLLAALLAAKLHDSDTKQLQPIAVRPETLTQEIEKAGAGVLVSYVFKLLSRRASKRTSFFDVAILACGEKAPTAEAPASAWPVVQLIMNREIVGEDCYSQIV